MRKLVRLTGHLSRLAGGHRVWGFEYFPKIGGGTVVGVPILRNYIILGSILESPHLGKLPKREKRFGGLGFWMLLGLGFGISGSKS